MIRLRTSRLRLAIWTQLMTACRLRTTKFRNIWAALMPRKSLPTMSQALSSLRTLWVRSWSSCKPRYLRLKTRWAWWRSHSTKSRLTWPLCWDSFASLETNSANNFRKLTSCSAAVRCSSNQAWCSNLEWWCSLECICKVCHHRCRECLCMVGCRWAAATDATQSTNIL